MSTHAALLTAASALWLGLPNSASATDPAALRDTPRGMSQSGQADKQAGAAIYTGAQYRVSTWKLTGDHSLRPLAIRDDGARIYLEWGAEQRMPAVFAVSPTGGEEVVDGYMRNGLFVIDRVHPKLVFRIDRFKAGAARRVEAAR